MKKRSACLVSTLAAASLLLPGLAAALDPPEKAALIESKVFRHPGFSYEARDLAVEALAPAAAAEVRASLGRLGAYASSARVDSLSGRFSALMPALPLVPGSGVGNDLVWSKAAPSREEKEKAALDAFLGFLDHNRAELGITLSELENGQRVASHGDEIYQLYLPRTIDGLPVRGSYVSATINHGNLVLMTTFAWGERPPPAAGRLLAAADARAALDDYLGAVGGDFSGKAEKLYVTLADGSGYRYPLVWSLKGTIAGDGGNWEALVDARSGEILSFEDTNHYAEAKGGVYPVTNDGVAPDGVEQAGWPMPFLSVGGGAVTDTGGNASVTGSLTASLSGTYIRMSDNCGAISLTQSGSLDFGSSAGTDCTTPGFGGAGNTHASRTGFYELNKIKEMARGQLPTNGWLQAQMTSNMNINLTCNAFWNGSTVNFYRSGGGCFNTGEIAGVFDHEWGHGLDDNDVNGNIASPSGEGIADVYSALRLNNSCIGRHFRSTVCTGFGDPCLTCTGVRDIDYLKRQSGLPHTYTWSNANCAGSVHCVGMVYSEAVWSLWKRKLTAAPYNLDNNTALEVVTRLTYIAAGNTGTWFSGGAPNGGCSATSGYKNYLAADDDNGNINDGTPHMGAIFAAFGDQQIACATPAVVNSGCATVPTTQPNVTATAGANSVALSWSAVPNATKYQVFRTEGVFACDFGKVKLGETTGTTFTSSNLQAGRPYSYVVVPIGAVNACMGPASACDTATPTAGGGGGGTTVYSDTFETATGWTVNPGGTDTATTGAWERGNPADTNSSGIKQLGTTVSGSNDLVTGAAAGSAADDFDLDGGVSSIQSPAIALPSTGTLTLSFSYYLAHGTNSSTSDYLRIFVVGATTTQVFQELGGTENDNGAWLAGSADISAYAGQNVRIRIEAADASTASLVEAGVDDVKILQN